MHENLRPMLEPVKVTQERWDEIFGKKEPKQEELKSEESKVPSEESEEPRKD